MPPTDNIIEVDPQAADILRALSERARANGQTLGVFLSHALPQYAVNVPRPTSQDYAWESFVTGMTAWAKVHLSPGYVADDSREAAYDDRT